jgi:ribonuclease BN (tRNA processing enzyme)
MAQEKISWENLDAIWISHFHLDHCGGLFPFLFATKYAPETQNRLKPLNIFGPKGLRALLERVIASNDYRLLAQPFPVEIIEVEPLSDFEILPGVTGVALDTPHTPESLAILIYETDRTLVFSSDTGFAKALANFAREVDLLILECSFVREKPVQSHLELDEAKYLIRKARPKRAMLTHFYPEWDDVDFRMLVGDEILEARDGLILDF